VICPSNPWVSIQPILSISGMRQAIEAKVVIAISPIIEGRALKGPAAKMYHEMGITPSALAVAQHYHGLLSGFILDRLDEAQTKDIKALCICPLTTDIVMKSMPDRARLAMETIRFGEEFITRHSKEKT